jgi:ELWxxDGT repeat protein
LWKSDGTFEGTVVVKSLPAGVNHMTAAGKTLFFVTSDQKLWATDGTEAGTRSLPAAPLDGVLAAAGDRVVFSATDTTNGQELWGSDGTIAGTHLLRDIYPGTIGSTPSELVSAEGMVYFRAFDDLHGSELWMTDGTSAGTTLAADVEPGLTSSFPRQFVRAGERLFFTATTAATGNELWALPLPPTPRLSINDIRVAEGQSGLTAAHFVVTVSPAPTTAVIVQYATSDGTGIAGRDYDAVSGALTFGPGETTKNIDVSVHGNVDPENNRTFFVTLLNATRATLAKSTGFAIIEDDDQIADLALTLDFSQFNNLDVLTNATNNGPRTATNITIRGTATPATVAASTCSPCPRLAQLAPGATAAAFDYRWFGFQQYLTATATIAQRDPQPSNNVVAWITNNNLAMDALYLTPGSQANVWYSGSTAGATVSIESSNPAILSVPSSLTTSAAGKPLSFVARAVSVGTATIRLFTPTATVGTLTVDVFPAGTKPRWPGALNVFAENSPVPFDTQSNVNIYLAATAPYTGETASGQVTIAANGREVAHVTLPSGIGLLRVPYYLPEIGSNPITVSYPGDANFLPMTVTTTVTSSRGTATLLGGAERNSTNARIHVRLAGSPMAAPTGTVTLTEAGTTTSAQISISATGGIAQGEITLSNISAGAHTFVLAYSGDARYFPSSQSVRLAEARGRSVRR